MSQVNAGTLWHTDMTWQRAVLHELPVRCTSCGCSQCKAPLGFDVSSPSRLEQDPARLLENLV